MLKPRGVYEEVAECIFYECAKRGVKPSDWIKSLDIDWSTLPEQDKEIYRDIAVDVVNTVNANQD